MNTTDKQPKTITIPGRITHAQFGCSPKVFEAYVKDKPLPLKGISPDGKFLIIEVAGEAYHLHKKDLISDDCYWVKKAIKQMKRLSKQNENQLAA